jgi:hypothetical protein
MYKKHGSLKTYLGAKFRKEVYPMATLNLLMSLPMGSITATSLSVEEFARHRSPGSGKYYQGRSILISLALRDDRPDFDFLDEGGWRDVRKDTEDAIRAALGGKRTKTALSNGSFSCTPLAAYQDVYLAKTGGQILKMVQGEEICFQESTCYEEMTPEEIAEAIGQPEQQTRKPRLYMIIAPTDFLVLSSLTPTEYAWYATHRPGKIFRHIMFTELDESKVGHAFLVAEEIYRSAYTELTENRKKKTKTIVMGGCLNRVPFTTWVGYDREDAGGLYAGDKQSVELWEFPEKIPRSWERAY